MVFFICTPSSEWTLDSMTKITRILSRTGYELRLWEDFILVKVVILFTWDDGSYVACGNCCAVCGPMLHTTLPQSPGSSSGLWEAGCVRSSFHVWGLPSRGAYALPETCIQPHLFQLLVRENPRVAKYPNFINPNSSGEVNTRLRWEGNQNSSLGYFYAASQKCSLHILTFEKQS